MVLLPAVLICTHPLVQPDNGLDEPDFDSEDEGSIDEQAFHLQDVSSDVEIDADELLADDDDEEEEKYVCSPRFCALSYP